MDSWANGQMDRWIDGQLDRWTDEQMTNRQIDKQKGMLISR